MHGELERRKGTAQHMFLTCGQHSRASSADMDRMQDGVEATMATHAMPSFTCQSQYHTHTGSLNFHWNDLSTHRIRLQTHSHTRTLHTYNGLVPLLPSPLPPPKMCISFHTYYLIPKREAYGLGPNKDIPCVDEDFHQYRKARDSGQNCTEPVVIPVVRGIPRHVVVKKGDRPSEWSSAGCDFM